MKLYPNQQRALAAVQEAAPPGDELVTLRHRVRIERKRLQGVYYGCLDQGDRSGAERNHARIQALTSVLSMIEDLLHARTRP